MRFFLTTALMASTAITSINALTSTLQQVTNFGTNPGSAAMYIYVPTKLTSNPPIVVAVHYCSGSARAYFSGTQYASLADKHGFIVVYPSSTRSGSCWDVASKASLTHNGGSDSLAIVNMAKYAQTRYSGGKIYVTGSSSGAMMTNVLAGAYPDVFTAAALFSGVPDGCFADPSGTTPAAGATPYWNGNCSGGKVIKSAADWAALVKSYYPGYSGARPKMQIWHGSADTVLHYNNYAETIKQWTGVFGLSQTPTSTQTNTPQSGYTKYSYGSNVVGYYAAGVGHGVPEHAQDVIDFFGLSSLTPGGSGQPTTTTRATTTTARTISTTTVRTTSTAGGSGGNCAAKYGQCGGTGFTGPACCQSGSTCKFSNQWYSQCL